MVLEMKCRHCGEMVQVGFSPKKVHKRNRSVLYCPTGRMRRDSPSQVKMKKALAEETLVQLVRKQAELLLEAEKVLKGRKPRKEPGADSEGKRAEMRRLDEAKISGYEDYKAGKMTREAFRIQEYLHLET